MNTAGQDSSRKVTMGTSESKEEAVASEKTKREKMEKPITYSGFDISALPEELFMHVLMFVPATDVVKQCSLVCKDWLAVCRDQSLWRRKCEAENVYIPGLMVSLSESFMVFYFKRPYVRNLLQNVYAIEELKFWTTPRGHNIPSVETYPAGADPIRDHIPAKDIKGKIQNWVTSYTFTWMSQTVDLLAEGCSATVLDDVRPPIGVSVWCAARWDCGAKFQVSVTLLDGQRKEIDKFEIEKDLSGSALRKIWHKVEHVFKDYKSGVRSITFRMGGVDTQFWAGNYGPKFTLPCVRFHFPSS